MTQLKVLLTVCAWMQTHSWIEPHPKFEILPLALKLANPLKLLLCMFVINLSIFKITICFPETLYSVNQTSKFEFNPTQNPFRKIETRGCIQADTVQCYIIISIVEMIISIPIEFMIELLFFTILIHLTIYCSVVVKSDVTICN